MKTELQNEHRRCLLEEMVMAENELQVQKDLLNESKEQYKETYEIKVFLAQKKIELIQSTIIQNSFEYKKIIS